MIQKGAFAMRRFLSVFLIVASALLFVCIPQGPSAPSFGPPAEQPKLQMKLSGPATIGRRDELEYLDFKATLTNPSKFPVPLLVRDGYLLNAEWYWIIKDAKGDPLGMNLDMNMNRGFCGTPIYSEKAREAMSHLHDSDLLFLQPGQSREFTVGRGWLSYYRVPHAGAYQFSVILTSVPPNSPEYIDEKGARQTSQDAREYPQWKLDTLSPELHLLLLHARGLQVTSDTWNVELRPSRPPRANFVAVVDMQHADLP